MRIGKVLLLGVICVALTAFWYYDLIRFLDVEHLRGLTSEAGAVTWLYFIAIYVVASLVFLPAAPLSLTAGVLFGPVLGTVLVVIGATLGATGAFLVSRYIARGFVERKVHGRFGKLREYDDKLALRGFMTTVFLRLIPVFPFNGLNFALGLTGLKLKDYFWGTFIGIIPAAFVYVYLGGSLASLNPWQILLAIALFGGLIILTRHLTPSPSPYKGEESRDEYL